MTYNQDFSKWNPYYTIKGFEELYLEDSYVLEITVELLLGGLPPASDLWLPSG